jgi:hypothetical protein
LLLLVTIRRLLGSTNQWMLLLAPLEPDGPPLLSSNSIWIN